jgi:hypothetical protein
MATIGEHLRADWDRYLRWRRNEDRSLIDALEQMPLEPGAVMLSSGVKGDVLNPHDRPEDDWPPGGRGAAGAAAGKDQPGSRGARRRKDTGNRRRGYLAPHIWWKRPHPPSWHAARSAAAKCKFCPPSPGS